jgi:shikimate dehydrogenase
VEPRRGAAVLGSPIAHSLSPVLHQAAYDALGLSDWHYRAIECTEADLRVTLEALDAEGLAGASLTMPLKRAVMPMLGYGGDSALAVGAANTVLFSDDPGNWLGANTDVPGMVAALSASMRGVIEGQTACVLGGGATAASAIAAIAAIGFKAVDVFARRPEAAADLESVAESQAMLCRVRPWTEIAAAASAPLVISTVPADATGDLARSVAPATGILFDVIYAPWPTQLAAAWSSAGGTVIGGLELLIEQAALQVALMTGETPPLAPMRSAGYAALGGPAPIG